MGNYFGTDGFRGLAGEGLTAQHAFAVGQFLGWYYGRGCRVLVGKDTRRSSYMLEYALCAGITSAGGDAYIMHVTTTPSVALLTAWEHFDCGVMISASHNPYYDNGLKLFDGSGQKLCDEVLQKIENFLDCPANIPQITTKNMGRTVDFVAGRNRYIGHLIALSTYSYKGVRVGLDTANGSSWQIAKSVFEALGATVYMLGNTPNGYNINEGVGSTHPEGLQALVKAEGLDVAFAFDGDADRCVYVDEQGVVHGGDDILYVLATHEKVSGIVATEVSNYGLMQSLAKKQIQTQWCEVGDRQVAECMAVHKLPLGGEPSGHILTAKHGGADGLVTALMMMKVRMEKECRVSELTDGLTLLPQAQCNVPCPQPQRVKKCIAVQRYIEELQGVRVVVRPSGTEEVVRVLVEGENCQQQLQGIVKVIKESLCVE